MKEYSSQKEIVELSKSEYIALLIMYYSADDEYTKFKIAEIYPEEEDRKIAAKLVHKNFAAYSDNTNKISLTLLGVNSVAHPPGLTVDQANECRWLFNPPAEKRIFNDKPRVGLGPTIRTPRAKLAGGVTKKDIVAKYLDEGMDAPAIFEAMDKDGVQTTVGSVRCFIKTIKEERSKK